MPIPTGLVFASSSKRLITFTFRRCAQMARRTKAATPNAVSGEFPREHERRCRPGLHQRPACRQSRDARRRWPSAGDTDELGVALCHELGCDAGADSAVTNVLADRLACDAKQALRRCRSHSPSGHEPTAGNLFPGWTTSGSAGLRAIGDRPPNREAGARPTKPGRRTGTGGLTSTFATPIRVRRRTSTSGSLLPVVLWGSQVSNSGG